MSPAERWSGGVALVLVVCAGAVAAFHRSSPTVADEAPEAQSRPAMPPRQPPERRLPIQPTVALEHRETPTGRFVAELVDGQGEALRPDQLAVVELTSWTLDGLLTDSTYFRPRPTRVRWSEAGEGWQEALAGLRVGGERQVVAPPGVDPWSPGSMLELQLVDTIDAPTRPSWDAVLATRVGGIEVVDTTLGRGPIAGPGSQVVLDYAVWPTVAASPDEPADSSTWRIEPFEVLLGAGRVRWEGALEGVAPGGRRVARLPAAADFGDAGRPPSIPPGADLLVVFDIHEVLDRR